MNSTAGHLAGTCNAPSAVPSEGNFPALKTGSTLQGLLTQQSQSHPVGLLRHLPALLLQQLQ